MALFSDIGGSLYKYGIENHVMSSVTLTEDQSIKLKQKFSVLLCSGSVNFLYPYILGVGILIGVSNDASSGIYLVEGAKYLGDWIGNSMILLWFYL